MRNRELPRLEGSKGKIRTRGRKVADRSYALVVTSSWRSSRQSGIPVYATSIQNDEDDAGEETRARGPSNTKLSQVRRRDAAGARAFAQRREGPSSAGPRLFISNRPVIRLSENNTRRRRIGD